jgi:hypothetical protein
MTVRQLEALIRLSEAIARSHLERVVSEFLKHNVYDDNIQYTIVLQLIYLVW